MPYTGPPGPLPIEFVNELKSTLGDPYVYGAAGPSTFDCSGLVQWGLEQVGLTDVPRTSEAQWAWIKQNGMQVNKTQLQPGDLVFSQWPGDNSSPGHVQVYIGGGQVIQAPHTGADVSIASLSADTGHIVGYGRVPDLYPKGGGGPVPGFPKNPPAASTSTDVGGWLSEAGDLLHGVSEVLDFIFGFFYPGQGWRIAFGAGAVIAGAGAVYEYRASGGGNGGSQFPAAVGLAGAAALAAFMALRPWPQEAGGPEKPGAYVASILEGQPPPPGPKRVKETGTIEAGLGVFAVVWAANKASGVVNSIVASISSILVGLGLLAA